MANVPIPSPFGRFPDVQRLLMRGCAEDNHAECRTSIKASGFLYVCRCVCHAAGAAFDSLGVEIVDAAKLREHFGYAARGLDAACSSAGAHFEDWHEALRRADAADLADVAREAIVDTERYLWGMDWRAFVDRAVAAGALGKVEVK